MTIPVARVDNTPLSLMIEPPDYLSNGRDVYRLNLNESPLPPAPTVIKAMARAASQAHRYPDSEGTELMEKLAELSGQPTTRIFIGAGSNELLAASAEITLDPGDEMVAPVPAFPTYAKLASIRGASFVGVPVNENGRIDVEAMLAAVTTRTRLMFVSSPHNPTGAVMTAEEILRLVNGLPDHVMLHFDEAYYEFGRAVGGPNTLPILAERRGPWISTRTFSKAYAMAGARVGYGFAGSDDLAQAIQKVRPNFSLNQMALAGAVAALDEPAYMRDLVAHILSERERIQARLVSIGYQSLSGAANFIALLPPEKMQISIAELREEGLYISGFDMGETAYLRITIGTSADSDFVMSRLGTVPNDARQGSSMVPLV